MKQANKNGFHGISIGMSWTALAIEDKQDKMFAELGDCDIVIIGADNV